MKRSYNINDNLHTYYALLRLFISTTIERR